MKKQNTILVLGAGGNIGGKIAQELLAQGEQVAVIGRSRARLSAFEGRAQVWEGDFADDAFLQQAFATATSLFLTVPDEAFVEPAATAQRLARLLQDTPITHIVNISNSIIKKAGAPTRLVVFEEALNANLPQHVLHLRCANFFENLNWGLHTPYRADLQLPYISSYEVAHVAAAHLQQQDFEEKQVRVLLGPRDYSMGELASAAGVAYQQLPYSDGSISFFKPFNEGDFEVEPRTDSNTSTLSQERFALEYFLQHELSVAQV